QQQRPVRPRIVIKDSSVSSASAAAAAAAASANSALYEQWMNSGCSEIDIYLASIGSENPTVAAIRDNITNELMDPKSFASTAKADSAVSAPTLMVHTHTHTHTHTLSLSLSL